MNILFLQAERFLEAMFLLRFKLRKLKRRCRVIQWQYPTFLAFFIIHSQIQPTLSMEDG